MGQPLTLIVMCVPNSGIQVSEQLADNNEFHYKLVAHWAISTGDYIKTCLKQPFKNRQSNGLKDKWLLNEGEKYCRMLSWSILQYL